ncbi:sigma-54-dependent transcriptional regulator [Desulfatiglans anilini]|uniref:sigma-54-dependent transcriptional regulator n=1 Tax=Desulfatiglans anilini TaxID=90728 RepID=UPI0004095849|nr:sigma-54 dependent transcriptional regulator [Desulfatiglans anilini]
MKILIVDDDPAQRELLQGFLENQGYSTLSAPDGQEALRLFEREPIHLVLLDHRMPGLSGDAILERLKGMNPKVRVIMITAFGDIDTAVSVMKLGASDFLEKPVDLSVLLKMIQQIEQAVNVEEDVAQVKEALADGPLPLNIIGESRAIKDVLSLARRMAGSPWPILVCGETGTGKQLAAQLIHLLSHRGDGPFVVVNCAAIPETLFESELFGHLKGAFTGASHTRRGRFELADGGTLMLDEIGEIPISLQPKLLRAIQEGRINPVGSEEERDVNVRLISATNRNLRKMVDDGSFREDLFYRIRVLEIEIPPLRHRREDIPPLLEFFLKRYGSPSLRLSPEAEDTLIKYPFPGNVRELEHVVQRTVTLARSPVITPADLPDEIRHFQATTQGTLEERLEAVEREMILSALEKNGWVQTRAADQLGISERVLRYKMHKAEIRKPGS